MASDPGFSNSPAVWPALCCRDARGLIKFLTEALGFEESLVVEDAGTVHHAELRWPAGGGLMLSDRHDKDGGVVELPDGPVSIYLVCDDPDALFERAVNHGAALLQQLKDEDYGSRGFSVSDPEGNVWTCGTYRGA